MNNGDLLPDAFADLSDDGNGTRLQEFSDSVELLSELSQAGLEDIDVGLQDTVESLAKLADSVEASLSSFNDDDPSVLESVAFIIEACKRVRQAALDDTLDDDDEGLALLHDEVLTRLETESQQLSQEIEPTRESDVVAPSQEEIAALLSGLTAGSTDAVRSNRDPKPVSQSGNAKQPSDSNAEQIAPASTPNKTSTTTVGESQLAVPQPDEVDLDEDLREAFMDDATRGLESMEQALLDLENSPGAEGPVKTIGRELHTIKGASASIGMANLAAYIHEVEELIRETQERGETITPVLLLPHVDLIRCRVEGDQSLPESVSLAGGEASADAPTPDSPAPTASNATVARPAEVRSTTLSESHGDDETVRVKASQLNRLMDMLSELVMLRNQRDTEISELKGIHDELVHSVTRIRMLSHEGEALLANDTLANPALAEEGVSFSHLNEVANDVVESAHRLRDCYQPVSDGNQAVSQFIRNFRLELVQMRRMPVSGLFRRLHRAISDAARTEQKQVRVELLGENTGIERSLQERIFEPLLHIVRNSVSHGIETPEARTAAGKSSHGTVTLHAHSGPDLLVIEVRDDGRGLDYDAIRRRGIERGLIESDKSVSHAELARLIFHPGFSTRETANQISGRGVGMDVVSSTLERMRGWVEVDSETGSGSTIRLSLPLPSMIQHALVFRTGGQLYALPAQAVRRTGEYDASLLPIDLNRLLSVQGDVAVADPTKRAIIELATASATIEGENEGDFALLVDRVLGPEEVVVRPMPPMLKGHPLCTGATLSGMGEVVLLLDPRALAEARQGQATVVPTSANKARPIGKTQPRVLVVDDSKSARLKVVRSLEKYPVTIIQAEDGQAAVELLAKETFATVFSDIDMPRMSGLELLESIRAEPRWKEIPVVMISSRSIETTGKQARKLGATEYIQKPATTERIDEVVSQFSWAQTSDI
ncbi:MAG: response regulator [Planctomycetota bacterium]